MLGYIISGVLFVILIILIALYREKVELVSDLEKDRQNIKVAYEKSLNNEQQSLKDKNEEIKKENKRLIEENQGLVKTIRNKDALFNSVKKENELLKSGNIKLNKELQVEKNKLVEQIDDINEERENQIAKLNSELMEAVKNQKTLEKTNFELINLNESLRSENIRLDKTIKERNEKISKYQEYVKELTSDINEFEQAYVAIGGKLSDIYEDYEE